jgi:hypothetical protein
MHITTIDLETYLPSRGEGAAHDDQHRQDTRHRHRV